MTETWPPDNNVQNHPVVSEFEKQEYIFHHRPRCSGRGGGIVILLRKKLPGDVKVLWLNHLNQLNF